LSAIVSHLSKINPQQENYKNRVGEGREEQQTEQTEQQSCREGGRRWRTEADIATAWSVGWGSGGRKLVTEFFIPANPNPLPPAPIDRDVCVQWRPPGVEQRSIAGKWVSPGSGKPM
jgi:hypothetical protein